MEEGAMKGATFQRGVMEKTMMGGTATPSPESPALVPLVRRSPQSQLEFINSDRLKATRPTKKSFDTTEDLFINLAELKLWEQLEGFLAPSHWEVDVSRRQQDNSGPISFSGSPETVFRAREAISKLLIMVGSLVRVNSMDLPQIEHRVSGFFRLRDGLNLFLWEGDASRFRVDAVMRVLESGGTDCGNAVFAQKVLNQRGFTQTNLDILFSHTQTVELGASVVKLALEAASQRGLQSLVITCLRPVTSTSEAQAVIVGIEAFLKDHPASPLKSINFVSSDGDTVSMFHKECAKGWPPGTSDGDRLRNALLSLEAARVEVVAGSSPKLKTDVVVVPLALDCDEQWWGPAVLSFTQRILEAAPHAVDLQPREILSVSASAFPEFDCRGLYAVRLAPSALRSKDAKEAIREMVWSCLHAFRGSFLETIAFPALEPADTDLAREAEWLLFMLQEIHCFLKAFPNTWMKRVLIVPLPGRRTPPCLMGDCCFTAALEPVGFCYPEDPYFLRYLDKNPDAFHQFKVRLKEVGYGIRMCSPWGILIFQAMRKPVELPVLGATFWSMREKYMIHCEIRTEVLEALLEDLTVVQEFKSIRLHLDDKTWFIGLSDEMGSFLQRLILKASQRQLVSREHPAEPLPRCTIVKDIVVQEMHEANPLVGLELLTEAPATIRFWGRCQKVEEAERRFEKLLGDFQVLPVSFSKLQFLFIKARWGKFFHSNVFLERGIPAVLEVSEVVQIAGLDLGKMKEAEETIVKQVHEVRVEIADDVKWATECEEWKELLRRLGSCQEIALHETTPSQLTVVGLCPQITQVEQSIREYLRENSPTEEQIKRTRQELAAAGQNLVRLMDWNHLKVHIKLESHGQVISLQVSGLRKYVRKAIPVINMDLDSLVLGTIPLKTKALIEYFSGVGAGVLKEIVHQQNCIARIEIQDTPARGVRLTSSSDGQVLSKLYTKAIQVIGRENHVASLKQILVGFIARFREEAICDEAIVTFGDQIFQELREDPSHQFPIGLCHLKDDEVQICGSQEDVKKVLESVRTKIEEYWAEPVEVVAHYETTQCAIVKDFLTRDKLLSNSLVNIEVLTGKPATVTFRGPRQLVGELNRHFEELLSGFEVLPVPLSGLQSQFVKAHRGELFCRNFFLKRGIPAVLKVSEAVQIAGLDLDKMKEAKEIIMSHVCERTVEVSEEVKWSTEREEWRQLLHRLGSHKEITIHHSVSSQVTIIGIAPRCSQVEKYIREYLMDNSPVEEKMKLARPELAAVGHNLLQIMDWDHLDVQIKIQSKSQVLLLQVNGLKKHVQEAIQLIQADLDCLVLGRVPLRKRALSDYFSGAGAVLLQEIAKRHFCAGRMQMQQSPSCGGGGVVTYSNRPGSVQDHWAELHAVGRESDVALVKQDLTSFIANFHEETVCSAETAAFTEETLQDLCRSPSHQYPVDLRRLRENVVRVCGSQEDVENVLGTIYSMIEEAVRTKFQKTQAELMEAKLLSETIRWHYKTDNGWSTFDIATNHRLETAYGKKEMRARLPWKGQRLEIDLRNCEALQLDRRKTFKIKREICLWDKNLVPHWEAMDGCLVKKVELQASSEEYKEIVKNFSETTKGFTVLKVERIQNRYLWVSYCWKRSWMEKKNPEGMQNEHILYHGTRPENCFSIQEIGFKSACRKVGIYGQGIYFARDAGQSTFYAEPDHQGHRFVFQARVLAGEYNHGNEMMVLPPMKPGRKGRYDSLVNILSKPTVFVTFFDDHAYPEYLITFRKTEI